jgi:arabinose-5-phosphate isomerase
MNFIKIALNVIETEAQAVLNLSQLINTNFEHACNIILNCKGKVIVTGVGKSGLIGKKISATFSSTGTPSIFLHPTEAIHGDFGLIQEQDVILVLSHSGYTEEICKLIPALKQKNISIIAITSNQESMLAKASAVSLYYGNSQEACILGLAPTTSTTLAMVLGDALAIALLEARKFNEKDFAKNHPGGSLGKKFIYAIDLAHKNENLPVVQTTTLILDALLEISSKKLGMTCVVDSQGQLKGVMTDGDIRRSILTHQDISSKTVQELMNISPKTIGTKTLAMDAIKIMETNAITSLVIKNDNEEPIAVLHIHDLIKAGFSI